MTENNANVTLISNA